MADNIPADPEKEKIARRMAAQNRFIEALKPIVNEERPASIWSRAYNSAAGFFSRTPSTKEKSEPKVVNPLPPVASKNPGASFNPGPFTSDARFHENRSTLPADGYQLGPKHDVGFLKTSEIAERTATEQKPLSLTEKLADIKSLGEKKETVVEQKPQALATNGLADLTAKVEAAASAIPINQPQTPNTTGLADLTAKVEAAASAIPTNNTARKSLANLKADSAAAAAAMDPATPSDDQLDQPVEIASKGRPQSADAHQEWLKSILADHGSTHDVRENGDMVHFYEPAKRKLPLFSSTGRKPAMSVGPTSITINSKKLLEYGILKMAEKSNGVFSVENSNEAQIEKVRKRVQKMLNQGKFPPEMTEIRVNDVLITRKGVPAITLVAGSGGGISHQSPATRVRLAANKPPTAP
jgi:hypothetical protein